MKSSAEKGKKRELKRLLSGSETLFLAAYWLSLRSWLLGGGMAGSHWCHSPVYQPDRRTIGPHVVVRKLSVSHAAAAYDIIQDQVWNTHTQTVCVTKNIHMLNLEIQTMDITYHQHLSLLTHTHYDTNLASLWIAPHGLANPLAVLPSTLLCNSPCYWQDINPRTSAHQNTLTNTLTHTCICTYDSWTVRQPKRKDRFVL